MLCFLDAFSGYHQIKMAVEDVEKTDFLTPCGVYCYTCMPFGLRNTGATFQRLMHIALGQQLGRNTEAYVDDIVVKSREARTLIQDLGETFKSLPEGTPNTHISGLSRRLTALRLAKVSSKSCIRVLASRDFTTMSST